MAKSQFEQEKSHSGRFWPHLPETISRVAELRYPIKNIKKAIEERNRARHNILRGKKETTRKDGFSSLFRGFFTNFAVSIR